MTSETLILAGGGTGGHVFPMIAVADELRALAPQVRLVFVGTERGLESQVVPQRGYELRCVSIFPIRGRGVLGAMSGAYRAALAIPEARDLVRELKPAAVFSMGGYAAGSVSLAARLAGIPLALMEPNSVIGLTNRLVAPWVQRAYTAFAEVESHFPARAVRRTGLAIRRGFAPQPYAHSEALLRVLVLGGSQGALALNEAVPEALSRTRVPVRVLHQAGKGKDEAVRGLYQRLGASSQVEVVPFIDDVPSALGNCDLVIGRSGAGACSEICAVGRPALLVPYPYASGNHQFHNADALVRSGAAECVSNAEATPERLAAVIDRLGARPERLQAMAAKAQQIGRPSAALIVARDLLELGGLGVSEGESGAGPEAAPGPLEVH